MGARGELSLRRNKGQAANRDEEDGPSSWDPQRPPLRGNLRKRTLLLGAHDFGGTTPVLPGAE